MTDDYEAGDDLYRVLDPDGAVVGAVPDLADETLVDMYRDMRLTRHFDTRAVSLQRQGRMGTYAPGAGQEAAQVGSTYALRETDWIVYQYREHGAVAARDLIPEYLLYWMGHEVGNEALADLRVAPLNITIADQIPHAVGMAFGIPLSSTSWPVNTATTSSIASASLVSTSTMRAWAWSDRRMARCVISGRSMSSGNDRSNLSK